ncbi:signal recognition particle-docking protein FtsY [Methylocapsa acidiphila]|uniref:signal recognition particle-docking protein FtsY n=1 Tax=Methylocapsa acidiphila TaxID=133552 RepID=UPI00056B9C08|nr:signal recognition particle-docking protein FtsY [Methylocapsa acidiphila]
MSQENDSTAKSKQSFFRRVFGRKESVEEQTQTQSREAAPSEPDQSLAEESPVGELRTEEALLPEAAEAVLVETREPVESEMDAEPEARPLAQSPLQPLEQAAPAQKRSWWARLREGLARSSNSIASGLVAIFTKRKLNEAMLDDLEDVLIRADLGVATASRIAKIVGQGRYDKNVEVDEVKAILSAEVERVLAPYARPLEIDPAKKPYVILVVGVNGSGKTTTIGKLAAKFTAEGQRVLLAAGDTFRAAAIEQLMIWGSRLHCPVISREQGADASALAFDAIKAAQERGDDIVLMDTAGRLQNRAELMAELEKIIRVMKKVDAEAPHAVLLVLDATVGQNAISQVEIFGRVAGVTGLVMTKLDGTARGGILVAITDKFQLPVHFIGIGETADDLEAFTARDFARAIAGMEE